MVAVLDTGVQRTHPFLSGKVVSEACYSSTIQGQSRTVCPNWTGGADGGRTPRGRAPCRFVLSRHARRRRGGRERRRRRGGFLGRREGRQASWPSRCSRRITSAALCGGIGAVSRSLGVGHHRRPRARVASYRTSSQHRRRQPEPGVARRPRCPAGRACRSRSSTPCARPASRRSWRRGTKGTSTPSPRRPAYPRPVSVGSTGDTDEVSFFSNVSLYLPCSRPGSRSRRPCRAAGSSRRMAPRRRRPTWPAPGRC